MQSRSSLRNSSPKFLVISCLKVIYKYLVFLMRKLFWCKILINKYLSERTAMKNFLLIIMGFLLVTACDGGGSNSGKTEVAATSTVSQAESIAPGVVNIYYFHNKQRCVTCNAIEKVVVDLYEKSYSDNENVNLKIITIGDDESDKIVQKYEVSFSSLIIASGDASTDLTEQGFANAVNKPEVLEDLITREIERSLE